MTSLRALKCQIISLDDYEVQDTRPTKHETPRHSIDIAKCKLPDVTVVQGAAYHRFISPRRAENRSAL